MRGHSTMVQDDQEPADDWIDAVGTPNRVSIVIPTCNRAELLSQTIRSIFAQDYRPIEIVVVDDASTDDTTRCVQQLSEQAPDGIDLIYHRQSKAGGPAARNCGARRTSGEFLVFMDDDDVFGNRFVASHVDTLRAHEHVDVTYCKWQRFRVEDGRYALLDVFGEFPAASQSPWHGFLLGWSLLLQGCMIRRPAVQAVGPWRPDLLKSQDLDYKARLLAVVDHVAEATEALIFYRIHHASVTGQLDAAKLDSYCQALDDIQQLAYQREDYPSMRASLADYLWSHAHWLTTQGAAKPAFRTLQMAKHEDPLVTRRNGPKLARVLSRCGLDALSGPLLYRLFRAKVALLGKRSLPVRGYFDQLPDAFVE